MRRLRLTINLPEYTCEVCGTEEDAETQKRNDVIFTAVLLQLLHGLAACTVPVSSSSSSSSSSAAAAEARNQDMQLELGVRSVSDGQHAWQEYRIVHPYGTISSRHEYWRNFFRTMQLRRNCRYGWEEREGREGREGQDGILPVYPRIGLPAAIYHRIFGARPLALNADGAVEVEAKDTKETKEGRSSCSRRRRYRMRHNPPVAAIVKTLVVGRRFYRAIHPATLHRLLHDCLPGVRTVHLEPWRPLQKANFDTLERGYSRLLATLPPSLRCLNVFLESDRNLHDPRRDFDGTLFGPNALVHRRASPYLGRRLAEGSNGLALINVAFLCDAGDFFAAASSLSAATHAWPRLATIVLTAAELAPTSSLDVMSLLLRTAAAVAARMPQLREVELWNVCKYDACSFSLTLAPLAAANSRDTPGETPEKTQKPEAHLTLRSTWPLQSLLTHRVVDAWRAVAREWVRRTWPAAGESHLEDCLVVTYETIQLPKYPLMVGMDGRMLVLNGGTLAGKYMFWQSRQGMEMERFHHWIMLTRR